MREVRGLGKNCIRSNHIRERHRVLRNQLNGEKLVKEGDSRLEEWKGLKEKERERERKGGGDEGHRADCSVKWMERGKTKRQTVKDGTCSNQGISADTHIYFLSNSFLSFSSSISSRSCSFPPSLLSCQIIFFFLKSLSRVDLIKINM